MKVTRIFQSKQYLNLKLPLVTANISAGFPSPADDFIDTKLDLNEFMIKHPTATFFVRVSGDSMIEAGIFDNDILVVDRSLDPKHNDVIIAAYEGELTVKRFCKKNNKIFLVPANEKYKPIEIVEDTDFEVWGVVTFAIHRV